MASILSRWLVPMVLLCTAVFFEVRVSIHEVGETYCNILPWPPPHQSQLGDRPSIRDTTTACRSPLGFAQGRLKDVEPSRTQVNIPGATAATKGEGMSRLIAG